MEQVTNCWLVWHSAMNPGKPLPLKEWQLLIKTGSLAGKKSRLILFKSMQERGQIRMGRRSGWTDLAFNEEDEKVSSQHCI